MLLTSRGSRTGFDPVLIKEPIKMRRPAHRDYAAWAELRRQSENHLTSWEENWTDDDLSLAAFRRRVKFYELEARKGGALFLFIFKLSDKSLLGGASLTAIKYGAARSAQLSYWIGAAHVRRGYATAALNALLTHSFYTLDLNRIEAACQPDNLASRNILSKFGFEKEGLARDYLKINGKWRDHEMYGLLARDFQECDSHG